jgi:hypothetical protein
MDNARISTASLTGKLQVVYASGQIGCLSGTRRRRDKCCGRKMERQNCLINQVKIYKQALLKQSGLKSRDQDCTRNLKYDDD